MPLSELENIKAEVYIKRSNTKVGLQKMESSGAGQCNS